MATSDGRREDSSRGRWRAVYAVAGWQTAASLCYYSVFAATGFVRTEFGVSRTLVGVFVTATILGYTLNLFPSGAAVDGFGEKRVMLVGLAALAVAAVGVSLAPTFGLLLVAGAVLGAAYSPAMPATNRGIVANAPRGRANFAMGLKQVGVTAGSAAASLVITGVGAVVAWQTGFWVIAVLAAAYGVVFAVTYDDGSNDDPLGGESDDRDGRSDTGSGSWSWPDTSGLAANRAYLLLVAAGFFIGASIFTMLGYVVPYVDEAIVTGGANSGAAAAASGSVTLGGYVVGGVLLGGLVLGGMQVMGSGARIGAGLLADRLGGSRGAATVALVQVGLAVALFGVLATGVASPVVAGVVFAGLGLSVLGSTGVFYSCLSAIVPPEQVGSASAGGQTAINAGGLVAPPLFGYLADTAGYDAGWALLAGLVAVATALLVGVRWSTEP